MPQVIIRHTLPIPEQIIFQLSSELRRTIAEQLTCVLDDGREIIITQKMVKLQIDRASEFDVGMPDIYVKVEARAFPSRVGHEQQYADQLLEALKPFVPKGRTLNIWYTLMRGGWGAWVA